MQSMSLHYARLALVDLSVGNTDDAVQAVAKIAPADLKTIYQAALRLAVIVEPQRIDSGVAP